MTACKNVEICGTEVLEAPSSLKLGVCLKCRGYYKKGISRKAQEYIFNDATTETP